MKHPGEVHVDHLLPLFGGHLSQSCIAGDAGIVHQYIYLTVGGVNRGSGGFYLFEVGGVYLLEAVTG